MSSHSSAGGVAALLGALLALGCAGTDERLVEPTTPRLATTDEMMGWINDIFDQGIRRPGYEANEWATEWSAQQFEDLGLDVRFDPVSVERWESRNCALSVWPSDDRSRAIDVDCMAIPYSTASSGLEGSVAEDEEGADLDGKIALYHMDLIRIPQALLTAISTDQYDPEGVFETLQGVMPFGTRFLGVMDPPVEAGATGVISVLRDYPRDTHDYFVPYDAVVRPVPGVWVSREQGKRIDALAEAGPISARMSFEGGTETRTSNSVIGTLEGMSDEWIVIGTHHDGPWGSAVEDASGMALVLAQAMYWASLPMQERPHNLLFLMNAGHMAGGAGLKAFVDRNQELLEQTLVEIHLEHVAKTAVEGPDGDLQVLDDPEARWWFVTDNPLLQGLTKDAIVRHELNRSFILEPTSWPPGTETPPTDGAFFFPDTPIIQHLAAPVYLFDSADTPDKVHQPSLVPITEAVIDIVEGLTDQSATGVREQTRETVE